MVDRIGRFALWGLPPEMIGEVVARGSIEGLIPQGLRALFGMAGQQQAAAAPDPIREGAIAILPISGVLSPRGQYGQAGNTSRLTERVRELGADPKVGTIILDMSTPGGLVYGTQEFGDAIFEVRASKPIIAVANNWMVASAGYWVATQASAFYGSPSSDVGSLGVYAGHTDMSGFEEKIGMKTTLVASDPEKIQGHGHAPLDDVALAEIQAAVDESNRAFIAAVARGRGMAAADVPAVHGKGRLVSAPKAAAAGAIDGVMTLRDVIAKYQSSRSRLSLMRRRAELLGTLTEI